MLTPVDIQNQDFAVKLRGYDADEVDDFLDMLGGDYEKLFKENLEQKDRIKELKGEIEHYKEMENTLRDSIKLAQSAAKDVQKATEPTPVTPATDSGDSEKYTAELEEKQKELKNLKAEIEIYKSRIKGNCSEVLEILEKMV